MIQLIFPFALERYDIKSDEKVPLTQEYLDILEEVHQAYGRIRGIVNKHHQDGFIPVDDLDAIHLDLKRRISVTA